MSGYHNNSIFWVETQKISPNPYQPRRHFEQGALEDLADSIRQYGVLQPLVVTRKESQNDDGGFSVQYELIAGERRLRASQIAGLQQVPVIIRKETDDRVKLELAIIENLQREDLNAIDRALAFEQLYKEFSMTHAEIGKKMGKSRVYVSNSLRLLSLPDDIKESLMLGRITEGHTRPLLMLSDRKEEQATLFKEIVLKKMSVRESEKIARKIAQDKVRKKEFIVDPRIRNFEKKLSENLGTRVQIEVREKGGKITIDYFTLKDLEGILNSINKTEYTEKDENMLDRYLNNEKKKETQAALSATAPINFLSGEKNFDNLKYQDKTNLVIEENSETINQTTRTVEYTEKGIPLEKTQNLITEFHHDKEEEIIVFNESLPEYHHQINQEISIPSENISHIRDNESADTTENQNNSSFENQHDNNAKYRNEQENLISGELSPDDEPENMTEYIDASNEIKADFSKELDENNYIQSPEDVPVAEAIKEEIKRYAGYDSSSQTQQNYNEQGQPANRPVAVQQQNYIQQQPQYNQQQYPPQRQDQSQYRQPKKGFFGRLFG